MIQRKQSLFLFLSAFLAACYLFVMPYYVDKEGLAFLAMNNVLLLAIGSLSIGLSLMTIFLFKNRKLQIKLCLANKILIIANCAWLIYSMYQIQDQIAKEGFGIYALALAYVMLAFASSAIKKDEALVSSVDRIR
ncbi:MAG: DUF4293 domain-containing protein [Flavobacteriales bacterium]